MSPVRAGRSARVPGELLGRAIGREVLEHTGSGTRRILKGIGVRGQAKVAFGRAFSAAAPFIMPALRDPAGQLRCLPSPARHELLVELVVLMDVKVAHFLVLGLAREERTQ